MKQDPINFNEGGDVLSNAAGVARNMGMTASLISKGQIQAAVQGGKVVIVAISGSTTSQTRNGLKLGHAVLIYSFQDAKNISILNPLLGGKHLDTTSIDKIITETSNVALGRP